MDVFKHNGGNTTGPKAAPETGSRGQAALLLIESLMHALVAKGVLSREDFIETVEGAAEVEQELMTANATSPPDDCGSFLDPLANAFRIELGR